MESAATTTPPAEGMAAVPATRRLGRIRLRPLIVPLCVLVALGVLGGVAVHLRHETEATGARVAAVRAQWRQATRELIQAQATLRATDAQSASVQAALTAATGQLRAIEYQLSKAQLSAFVGGLDVSDVEMCLGGVRVALNELGLGNAPAAAASLTPVAQSCQAALGG